MSNNRCANTEALNRYEREVEKAEKEYEERCDAMYDELEELIVEYLAIAKRYDLKDEARQFMEDMI